MVCIEIVFPKYKECFDCKFCKSKFPPVEPPLDNLKKYLPSGMSLVSFEGVSINFGKKEVTRFFRLREYVKKDEASREKIITEILKWLNRNREKFVVSKEIAFSTRSNLSFVFVPANYPYEEDNIFSELYSHPIIVVTYYSAGCFTISTYNIKNFRELIKKLRGGKSFERPKQLKVARTYFECYLANKTQDPWPGDIDALICKSKKGKHYPFMLVEFKTHNLNTPIEEEESSKYSKEDKRRLTALSIIQKSLEVNLIYIIWSRNYPKIKVEISPFSYSKKEKITKICKWEDLKSIFLEF